MQKEGAPVFLRYHQGSVRGVSFSPRDRYLFCSGSYDGKVNLYTAQHMELLMCYQIASMGMSRNINAVRFTSDGSRVSACSGRKSTLLFFCQTSQCLDFGGNRQEGISANEDLKRHFVKVMCHRIFVNVHLSFVSAVDEAIFQQMFQHHLLVVAGVL